MATIQSLELHVELKLEVRRCYDCGQYWAIESTSPGPTGCPLCTQTKLGELKEERSELERRLIAQRGATTRARSK